MAQKEFTYRGKTLEELKKMDIREFSKLLPSRERRTVLRQFNEIEKFVNDCKKKISKKKNIKTHIRNLVVVPQMVGMKISIYNGKTFIPVEIIEEMVGHRLGEFSLTRARIHHGSAGVGATKGSKAKSKK
jgi:small subunit ribosomal protein S19